MAKTQTVVTVISKISDHPLDCSAALVVIYGTDLGRKHDLFRKQTVIGRSSRADIQIDQESISRSHAMLLNRSGHITLRDLGSTNGTYLNDEAIEGDALLRNGDLVKIGRTIFKFIAGGNIESAYHDEIYRLTTVDGLTQAFNRRYFEEALDREVSRCNRYARSLALVMMDIDRFKEVNDNFGHIAGDYVLKQLAQLIRTRTRREDVFARYGGEEFALLLPELDDQGAVAMADKARRLVEEYPFTFDGESMKVTISLGCAVLQPPQADGPELVRAADAKLYEAKAGGRNRVSG